MNEDLHLVKIYIPLASNSGVAFAPEKFSAVKKELLDQFGGLTAFTQAPADGLWEQNSNSLDHDKIVIFEVLTKTLNPRWWDKYRKKLEQEFSQDSIQIFSQKVRKL